MNGGTHQLLEDHEIKIIFQFFRQSEIFQVEIKMEISGGQSSLLLFLFRLFKKKRKKKK